MKTKTLKSIYNLFAIIVLIIGITIPQVSLAQSKQAREQKAEKADKSYRASESDSKAYRMQSEDLNDKSQKIITASTNIDTRPKVTVNIYDVNTEILPARNSAVEVQVIYHAEGNENDLKKLENALQHHLLEKKENKVSVSTRFYKNYISNINTPVSSKVNIELKDGTKITLTKFKISKMKVFVPGDLDLVIDGKYCEVDIDFSIHGELDITGYDIDLAAKNVSGNTIINGKYSKFKFGVLNTTKMNGYETKFKANKITSFNLDSKYSEFEIEQIGDLNYSGYEDEMELYELDTYTANTKYSKIEIESAKSINSTMYEGELEITTCKTASLISKYVKYEFGNLNSLTIKNGYENDIYVDNIKSFSSTNSKYNKYELSNLETSFTDTLGYENKTNIEQLGEKFSLVSINGKYAKLNVNVPDNASFVFQGKVQYPDFETEKAKLKKVLSDKDGSKYKFLYYKGKKDYNQQIRASGYEVDVTIDTY